MERNGRIHSKWLLQRIGTAVCSRSLGSRSLPSMALKTRGRPLGSATCFIGIVLAIAAAGACSVGKPASVVASIVGAAAEELRKTDEIAVESSVKYSGSGAWRLVACMADECAVHLKNPDGSQVEAISPAAGPQLIELASGSARAHRLSEEITIPQAISVSGNGPQWVAFRLVKNERTPAVQLVEMHLRRSE